ncbi:MAG: hypothetical protein R2716_14325 [Microthrixaceae bacterium]
MATRWWRAAGRRCAGITLAPLAILGASIGLLQTAASSNESAKAREATRLAVEAQTAQVLAEGLDASVRDAFAQVESFESRPVFSGPRTSARPSASAPTRTSLRSAWPPPSSPSSSPSPDDWTSRRWAGTAAATELFQKAAVAERIEWNAKASQYETVLTVLAIAVFLVGFTLVLGRKLRPPIAVPGALLALYCLGWAVVIYSHPIPSVDDDAVKQTAAGEVALQRIEGAEAVADFDAALEADPGYVPALSGRALARVVEDNPDLLETLAVTSPDAGTYRAALRDLSTALDNGGDRDPRTLSIASLLALLAGEWDRAGAFLDDASELNSTAAALYLWHAALEVAEGDTPAARDWLERARDQFGDIRGGQRRALVAQLLSLLEVVASREPAAADHARDLATDVVAAETAAAAGRALEPGAAGGSSLEVLEARYDDGVTTVRFELDGVDDAAAVALVGYERPAPGADWVQPAELHYTGPAADVGRGVTVRTPRRCTPVEYRFDLYVEGVRADSVEAPGTEPTC